MPSIPEIIEQQATRERGELLGVAHVCTLISLFEISELTALCSLLRGHAAMKRLLKQWVVHTGGRDNRNAGGKRALVATVRKK